MEDTTEDVVLAPCKYPESVYNFVAWQEAPQRRLPSLFPHCPPCVEDAASSDNSIKAVIHIL